MASSEVFRPSAGELYVRSHVTHGPEHSPQPKNLSRPPSTAGGYRFGQLSHNSFFTRHNPHPARVSHMKGLLDVPICCVNDDGFVANPRYSMGTPQTPSRASAPGRLQFPPNGWNNSKIRNYRIPANAININSQLHPINTITGLQYFTGLNSYPWREKAIPRMGLVPVTETWQDELRNLTNLCLADGEEMKKQNENVKQKEEKRRGTQYSATTGRLIPPPSRALSRGGPSRGMQTMTMTNKNQRHMSHIRPEEDYESIVFTMLCQILQTEDFNAVQAWLCSAPEREKQMIQQMVAAALASQDDVQQHYVPPNFVEEPPRSSNRLMGVVEEDNQEQEQIDKVVERLSIADGHFSRQTIRAGEVQNSSVVPLPDIHECKKDEAIRPPTTSAFRNAPGTANRPASQANKEATQAKFRFTQTSAKGAPKEQVQLDLLEEKTWNPNDSQVNPQ